MIESEDAGWLLDALAAVIAAGGEAPFLSGEIRVPTTADFPDPWHGDLLSLRLLCERLMGYAGLEGLALEIVPFAEGKTIDGVEGDGKIRWRHEGAAAWFSGIRNDTVHFGCSLGSLQSAGSHLVGVMAHEVAHAWRAIHDIMVDDRDAEERMTDLTTIYLGFGVFTLNNTHRYRSYQGETALISGWRYERAGYLPPEAMAFLLATQLVLRGTGWWAKRRLFKHLEPNQRGYVKTALRQLGPRRGDLNQRLGLDVLADPPRVVIS